MRKAAETRSAAIVNVQCFDALLHARSVLKGNHFAILMILVSADLLVPRQSLAFLCAKLFGCI